MKVFVAVLALAALALADEAYPVASYAPKPAYQPAYQPAYKPAYQQPAYKPTYSQPAYKPAYQEAYAPAYYNFDYTVKDDYTYVDMGHQETRNGDNTKGSYNVVLPDGRRQIVNYYVDGYSGYVADVQYTGEAKYDYKPAYKPAQYAAPAYPTPAYPAPAYTAPAAYPTPRPYVAPSYKPAPAYKPVY